MKTSPVTLAKHFGELAYLRGIVSYRLSPFEQRAFAGFLKSLPRIGYRIGSNVLAVVPPFAIAYFVFTETQKKFHDINRKNPADYANDK